MYQSIYRTSILLLVVNFVFGCQSNHKKENQALEKDQPKITRPEVRKVWVPDQIHDNMYDMGHWQYLIDKQSVWSKRD